MTAKELRCEPCLDAVCRETKLLMTGAWKLGEDARYHWSDTLTQRPACAVARV